eukprot:4934450-Pyramimonas_sp.AAC.1
MQWMRFTHQILYYYYSGAITRELPVQAEGASGVPTHFPGRARGMLARGRVHRGGRHLGGRVRAPGYQISAIHQSGRSERLHAAGSAAQRGL